MYSQGSDKRDEDRHKGHVHKVFVELRRTNYVVVGTQKTHPSFWSIPNPMVSSLLLGHGSNQMLSFQVVSIIKIVLSL